WTSSRIRHFCPTPRDRGAPTYKALRTGLCSCCSGSKNRGAAAGMPQMLALGLVVASHRERRALARHWSIEERNGSENHPGSLLVKSAPCLGQNGQGCIDDWRWGFASIQHCSQHDRYRHANERIRSLSNYRTRQSHRQNPGGARGGGRFPWGYGETNVRGKG